jgi:hypothetical protein
MNVVTTKRIFIFTLMMLVTACHPPSEKKVATSSPERIGIYDSRCIATAYIGSDIYKQSAEALEKKEMMADYRKAKAEGDKKRVKEIKKLGKSQQGLMHEQGFGTAPVDNILEQVSDQLPEIMEESGVGMLVSKWDNKTLKKYKSSEQIDVTMLLVNIFNPDEKTKKYVFEIQQKRPFPRWIIKLL